MFSLFIAVELLSCSIPQTFCVSLGYFPYLATDYQMLISYHPFYSLSWMMFSHRLAAAPHYCYLLSLYLLWLLGWEGLCWIYWRDCWAVGMIEILVTLGRDYWKKMNEGSKQSMHSPILACYCFHHFSFSSYFRQYQSTNLTSYLNLPLASYCLDWFWFRERLLPLH